MEVFRGGTGEDSPELAKVLSHLGLLYDCIDDADSAEDAYTHALEILKTHVVDRFYDYLVVLNNLALNYRNTHREDIAEQMYMEGLELLDKVTALERDAKWVYHEAMMLHNLSGIYRWTGNFERAETIARESLAQMAECRGTDSAEYEISLHNLGLILSQQGKDVEAEQVLREALERRSRALGERGAGSGSTVSVLAALLVRTERLTEAFELMEQELSRDNQKMWRVFSVGSERQRMSHLDRLRKNMFGFLSFVLRHGHDLPEITEKACDVILRRKAISLEVLSRQWQSALAVENPNLLQKMEQLQSLKSQLANLELSAFAQDS